MNYKKIFVKTLSILTVFCLSLGVVNWQSVVTPLNAASTPYSGNHIVFYENATSGDANYVQYGLTWDADNKTLTMDGFNGSGMNKSGEGVVQPWNCAALEIQRSTSTPTTIILKGDNVITTTAIMGLAIGGTGSSNLIIKGDGKLTIIQGSTYNDTSAIISISNLFGGLTIEENASLYITGTWTHSGSSTSGEHRGISVTKLDVYGTLNVTTGTVNAVNIDAQNFAVMTTGGAITVHEGGAITAIAGDANSTGGTAGSTAVYTTNTLTVNGSLTAFGKAATGSDGTGTSFGLNVGNLAVSGDIYATGYTKAIAASSTGGIKAYIDILGSTDYDGAGTIIDDITASTLKNSDAKTIGLTLPDHPLYYKQEDGLLYSDASFINKYTKLDAYFVGDGKTLNISSDNFAYVTSAAQALVVPDDTTINLSSGVTNGIQLGVNYSGIGPVQVLYSSGDITISTNKTSTTPFNIFANAPDAHMISGIQTGAYPDFGDLAVGEKVALTITTGAASGVNVYGITAADVTLSGETTVTLGDITSSDYIGTAGIVANNLTVAGTTYINTPSVSTTNAASVNGVNLTGKLTTTAALAIRPNSVHGNEGASFMAIWADSAELNSAVTVTKPTTGVTAAVTSTSGAANSWGVYTTEQLKIGPAGNLAIVSVSADTEVYGVLTNGLVLESDDTSTARLTVSDYFASGNTVETLIEAGAAYFGIYTYGDSSINGTIIVNAGKAPATHAAHLQYGELELLGGTVTLNGYNEAGLSSYGLRAEYGTLKVSGGTLNATGATRAAYLPSEATLADGIVAKVSAAYNAHGTNGAYSSATYDTSGYVSATAPDTTILSLYIGERVPDNFTLYFPATPDGKLYMDVLCTQEYTEQTDKWSISSSTLTLKDGFYFETTALYALQFLNTTGTRTIVIEDGARAALISGDTAAHTSQMSTSTTLMASSGTTLEIKGNGLLELFGGSLTGNKSTYGMTAGNLTITDTTVVAQGGNHTGTASYGTAGLYLHNTLTLKGAAHLYAYGGDTSGSSVSTDFNQGIRGVGTSSKIILNSSSARLTASTGPVLNGNNFAIYKVPELILTSPLATDTLRKKGSAADGSATLSDIKLMSDWYVLTDNSVAKYVELSVINGDTPLYFNPADGLLYRTEDFTGTALVKSTWNYSSYPSVYEGPYDTLTLGTANGGFSYTTTATTAMVLPAGVTLTLRDGSTSSLTADGVVSSGDGGAALKAKGNLLITGKGTLSLYAPPAKGENGTALDVSGTLTVKDSEVGAIGANGTNGAWSVGIEAYGGIILDGAYVFAVGGNSTGSGGASIGVMLDSGNVTLKNGAELVALAGAYSSTQSQNLGLRLEGGTVVLESGSLLAMGGKEDGTNKAYGAAWLASAITAPDDVTIEGWVNYTDGVIMLSADDYDTTKKAYTSDGKVMYQLEAYYSAPAPVFTGDDNKIDFSYIALTWQLTATGATKFEITAGTLPNGLTMTEAGHISGRPLVGWGDYTFTVKASNDFGSVEREYTLTLREYPEIITETLPGGTVNEAYSAEIEVIGSKPITFTVTAGELPEWLTLDSATGVLSGTPTAGGLYAFTITATNEYSSASMPLTLGVSNAFAPVITKQSLSDGLLNEAYSDTLTAQGTSPITWERTAGALPTGLTLSDTGAITGTPTADGDFTFTVKATNSAGSTTKEYTITVHREAVAPTITSASTTTVKLGEADSFTVTATGTGTKSYVLSGQPTGVTISSSGVISIPSTLALGEYTFTITVSNGTLPNATQTFTLKITDEEGCVVTVAASPTAGGTVTGGGTYNVGDTVTVTASSNSGYSFGGWSVNGAQVSSASSYTFTVTADITLTAAFTRNQQQNQTPDPDPDPDPETPPSNTGDVVVTAKSDENAPDSSLEIPDWAVLSLIFTEEELALIEAGETLALYITVTDIADSVSDDDKAAVEGALGGATLGMYLDISLFKQVGEASPVQISKVGDMLRISIEIPEELRGENRVFKLVRVHEDGEIEVIFGEYDEETGVFTFETDKFSTYALVYEEAVFAPDEAEEEETDVPAPETVDEPETAEEPEAEGNPATGVGLGSVILAGLAAAGVAALRRRRK